MTEFAAVQRSLSLFVRGLLGHGVPLHLAPPGTTRAFANEHGWFFPLRYPMYGAERGRDTFYAAAAHLAAHTRFGAPRMKRGSLRAIQVVLVSLFEDARAEHALLQELPGLRRLFAPFHAVRPTDTPTFPTLCARIARGLFEPVQDDHPIVQKALRWGIARSRDEARGWGSLLGNDVGQMRLPFNEKDYAVDPPYRDDHRLLWEEPEQDERAQLLERPNEQGMESGTLELAKSEPRTASVDEPARAYRYPEYDYQIRCARPAFCTVEEQVVAPAGSAAPSPWVMPSRLRVSTLARRRREAEGDALDLPAALDASIAVRAGHDPDPRVFVRVSRQRQPIALTLLLDLSASTGDRVRGLGASVLELARDASLSLAEQLAHAGDRFAVHGFSSNGRHHVEYLRYKELDQAWGPSGRAALHALTPRQSTRMGPAIRHAGRSLRRAREPRRVVLLLTDGAPSDIDVADPRYLVHDARHAVAEARRAGVAVFAVSLDPGADRYMGTIFGPGRYLVLDRPAKLPEVLTRLYDRLSGS
jgi:nitric oxide reductase NorD protein